jgi:hypothetical protein
MTRPFGRRLRVPAPRNRLGEIVQDVAAAIAIGAVIGVGIFWADIATSHSFYDLECCSDRDCGPVATDEVMVTPSGYRIARNGEIIAFDDKRLRPSPDGRFHICQVPGKPGSTLLCLYVPEGNA